MRACPECHTPYPDDQVICPIDGQALNPRVTVTVNERASASRRGVVQAIGVARPANDSENDLLGQTLGSYRVLSVLGKGGMGQVFLAEHIKLGRRVALKILRPEFAAKRDAVSRFFQEAKAVSRIRHKNIVDVTDFVEEPDGTTFIVMELLEGMTLGEKFRRKSDIPLREGLETAIQVCDGLEAAHREGIIHRDLKPDNIFLCADAIVKILDFGVAKLMGEADAGWQTMQGSVVGTPAYMSPEQAAGIAVDHRADIYSLGTILYEIFTGRRVFEAKSFGEFVLKHMSHDPVPPRDLEGAPPLPRELEKTVLKCLEKRPEDRYQTAGELRAALVESLAAMETASVDAHVARAKRRRSFYLGMSIGAAGLAAALAFVMVWRPPTQTQTGGTQAQTGANPTQAQPVVVEQLGNPAPAPPRRITLKFHSEPEGAEVLDPTGAILGRTPLTRETDGDGNVREYLFRHDGFRDKRLRVSCDQDRSVLAVLEHASAPPAPQHPTDHARPEPPPRPDRSRKIDEHVTVDPFKDE